MQHAIDQGQSRIPKLVYFYLLTVTLAYSVFVDSYRPPIVLKEVEYTEREYIHVDSIIHIEQN